MSEAQWKPVSVSQIMQQKHQDVTEWRKHSSAWGDTRLTEQFLNPQTDWVDSVRSQRNSEQVLLSTCGSSQHVSPLPTQTFPAQGMGFLSLPSPSFSAWYNLSHLGHVLSRFSTLGSQLLSWPLSPRFLSSSLSSLSWPGSVQTLPEASGWILPHISTIKPFSIITLISFRLLQLGVRGWDLPRLGWDTAMDLCGTDVEVMVGWRFTWFRGWFITFLGSCHVVIFSMWLKEGKQLVTCVNVRIAIDITSNSISVTIFPLGQLTGGWWIAFGSTRDFLSPFGLALWLSHEKDCRWFNPRSLDTHTHHTSAASSHPQLPTHRYHWELPSKSWPHAVSKPHHRPFLLL